MQITRSRALFALALALLPAACQSREPAPPPAAPRAQILKDVPSFGRSTLLDTTGTSDAERRSYSVVIPADTIAAAYRTWLPHSGWTLYNDYADRAGGRIDLYARKGRATLWVHIEKRSETVSDYTLIANAEDSTSQGSARKADSVR